jgi:hypothetical protein
VVDHRRGAHYAAAATVSGQRERSKSGDAPNRHPATKRTYRLRSYVTCGECGRRMHGKVMHRKLYYGCQPRDGRRPQGHPVSVSVPETPVLEALGHFFNTWLLGPDRAALLLAGTGDQEQDAIAEHTRRLQALERQIADIATRQDRLMHQAENQSDAADAGAEAFTAGLRRRYNDLETERRSLDRTRDDLIANPPQPGAAATHELLELLPMATLNLAEMPTDILRELCDAFRIKITFDRNGQRAHFTAEVPAESIAHLQDLLEQRAQICCVPPAGFEPALPPPETGAPRDQERLQHARLPDPPPLSCLASLVVGSSSHEPLHADFPSEAIRTAPTLSTSRAPGLGPGRTTDRVGDDEVAKWNQVERSDPRVRTRPGSPPARTAADPHGRSARSLRQFRTGPAESARDDHNIGGMLG